VLASNTALLRAETRDGSNAESVAATESAPHIGSAVSDFPYDSTPYGWRHFHDLAGPAGVVLVFDPTDADLTALEHCRPALAAGGLEPVAVLHESDGSCWHRLAALQLSYSLLSDPKAEVDQALGASNTSAGGDSKWFVIDTDLRIRALGQGGIEQESFVSQFSAVFAGRAAGPQP
jgi:peroxiredoxin